VGPGRPFLAALWLAAWSARAQQTAVPGNHGDFGKNTKTVLMSFDKRDLADVIQFVSQFTQRNFILPERISGKVTILSNAPIPASEVWNVFVAALDANGWAVYPVGRYWKVTEKKQAPRAGVPLYLDGGQPAPGNEQMVTKLFKLRFVDAEEMRNVLNQFTSRDADLQIFPPDTLIVSDVGLNLGRLEQLIGQLDQPGGSQEIHIVSVRYAAAPELAQKLNDIAQAQASSRPGPPGAPAATSRSAKVLADERTNKLIVIAGDKPYQALLELLQQLDVPTGDSGAHVYALRHAKAEDLATTLQSLTQGTKPRAPATTPAPGALSGPAGPISADLFNGEVKVTADKSSNSLIVIASQGDYRNLIKLVEQLDTPRRQVFVEAVIMEVNLETDRDVGVAAHGGSQKDATFGGVSGAATGVLGTSLGGLSSINGISSLASLNGFLGGIQGPPITVGNVTVPAFGIVLQALQSSSDVNVISNPHLIMTDNTEGEIAVGQNVPFQAAFAPNTGSTTPSTVATSLGQLYAPIQRQNVELKLHIRPQINEGDVIRLEVEQSTEEIASVDKTLGPTTSKRSAKTTVMARDQETVVLGGLIQERVTRSVSKVPVLGSLPLLGWLFRSESTKKQKTNLLLFLTPYIIRDQSDVRRIFERKMAEREEFMRRFYRDDAEMRRFIDYDRKPGPFARIQRGVEEEMARIENGGPGSPGEKLIGSQEPP